MKNYRITVNGNIYDVAVQEMPAGASPAPVSMQTQAPLQAPSPATAPAAPAPVEAAPAPKNSGAEGTVKLNSPLPGSVFKISVKEGQPIQKGQVVFVIEAMKMENEIVAPAAGTVASINVSEGATVSAGDLLMTIN